MYSKSLLKVPAFLLLIVTIFSLSACNTSRVVSATMMEFSFNTSTPTDSYDEKSIYSNDDMAQIILNAELKIDSGAATIQVQDMSNDELVWSQNFNQDSCFSIELTDVKADSDYSIKIQTTQSQKVNLVITSDSKLVRDKEKPEKYSIDK